MSLSAPWSVRMRVVTARIVVVYRDQSQSGSHQFKQLAYSAYVGLDTSIMGSCMASPYDISTSRLGVASGVGDCS